MSSLNYDSYPDPNEKYLNYLYKEKEFKEKVKTKMFAPDNRSAEEFNTNLLIGV